MHADLAVVENGIAPDGQPCLALVANRAYRIVPGGRSTPLGEVPEIRTDDPAFEPFKPLTDVLVSGSAHATRGSVTELETSVEVGAVKKRVRVLGGRTVEIGANGRISFTSPKGFTEMPLVWENAYGGRDLHAEKRLAPRRGFGARRDALGAVSYPRNARGRGYFLDMDRERLQGASLPNLEDPTDPIAPERILSKSTLDWIDRPVAACYEPIDVFTFPRAAFFIRPVFDTQTRPVHELASGAVLAEDLTRPFSENAPRQPRVYNRAPAGLAVCSLTGRERVKLANLHRERSNLEFDLPDDTPKLILDLPGVGERKLEPKLSTVSIEPDKDRVVLTWAASVRVAMPYPEEMTRSMRRVVRWERKAN